MRRLVRLWDAVAVISSGATSVCCLLDLPASYTWAEMEWLVAIWIALGSRQSVLSPIHLVMGSVYSEAVI